jgi:MFS family permease
MDPAAHLSAAPAKVTIWNRNFICAISGNFLFVMAHWSVNTLVATYVTHLGAAPVIMGFLTGMFFAVSLVLHPIAGPVITKIDKRKLMILAYALGAFVNLGYAMFHSIPVFICFRVLHGVQYGFVGALIMTMAGDSLPKEKLASGMGIYGIGGAIGTALGPAFSIAILNWGTHLRNDDFGFTLVFLIAAVLQMLALIPSIVMHSDKRSKEDNAKTGAWYKNIVSVHALPSTVLIFLILTGFALYNAYVVNLAKEQGIGNISLFYTFMAVFLVIFRPLSGWLTDRFGVAKVVIPGLVIFGLSFVIVGSSKSLEMILVGAAIAAIGVGSTQPAIQAMCIQSESPLKRSVASNTIYIGMDLGLFVGPFLGGIVYEHSSYAFVFKAAVVPIAIALICLIIFLPGYHRRLRTLAEETALQ